MYHRHYNLLSAGRNVCTGAALCATAISLQKDSCTDTVCHLL